MTTPEAYCPGCRHQGPMEVFYSCRDVPVNSVTLFRTKEAARDCRTGDISLVCCPSCGLIHNGSYDPAVCRYNAAYEESQSHSPVFHAFHLELAEHLINRYNLRGKNILEIGCGKGDFINLICGLGGNTGIGYDPAYVAERSNVEPSADVTIFNRKFSPGNGRIDADIILCKMTLEHIPDTAAFLQQIRNSIDPGKNTRVFFQVPDAGPIFARSRFWDIYYEHCSYFTGDALGRIFRLCGFDILHLDNGYDGQYLLLEAETGISGSLPAENGSFLQEVRLARSFADSVRENIRTWRQELVRWSRKNLRVALWGGGSKAVSFLTTLNSGDKVEYVVDINPYKQGTFLPGTGHEIIAPADLKRLKPDIIIVMNPVYLEEINGLAKELRINADLVPLTGKTVA